MKKKDLSAMKDRDLIFNKIIKWRRGIICVLYIPKIKLDQTSQSIYFFQKKKKKKLSRNGAQKISSLCPVNMAEAGMCILKKKKKKKMNTQ